MNRLAGETACPTHRHVVWLPCGAGSVACLPRCSTDSFTPSQSEGGRGAVRELAGLRAAATELLQGLGGTVVRQTVTVSAFQRLESVNRQVWPDHVHIDAKFRLPVLLTVSSSAGL